MFVQGDGATRMVVQGGLANPKIMNHSTWVEAMAQLLQQTNIIRDIHEDHQQNRRFWPEEVWSKHVDEFSHLMRSDADSRRNAVECSSEMVLLALCNAPACPAYMAGGQEQSIFNFVAIPQAMAIATLELCFQNPAIFERNVEITRGQACQLLIASTKDLRHVGQAFRKFAGKIRQENNPNDPCYGSIDDACNDIDRAVEDVLQGYQIPWTDSGVAVDSQTRKLLPLAIVVAVLGVLIATWASIA